MLDLKIEGATVIDGTGVTGGRADVGILDDRIVAVGDLSREPAGNRLHASGKTLAPGFIDMHSHSDWRLWAGAPRRGLPPEWRHAADARARQPSRSVQSWA